MEEWKEFISGFSVSNFGRIRNDVTNHVYKPQKRYKKSDHYSVHIKGKNYSVSRMVALHFIPNPENFPVVRHWDGNAENNHHSNLKWGTQKDNTEDAFRHGTHTSLTNEGYKKQQNETLKPSKVRRLPKSGHQGIQTFYSIRKTKMLYRVYVNTDTLGPKYFGSFESLDEAIRTHKEEYFKIFGVYP
jgi:hypothetical protein